MKLIPWRGRGEVASFRSEFDDLFDRFFDYNVESKLPAVLARGSVPPINVAETDKSWSVSVELPGLDEKDIQLQLVGNHLQISAERKWEEEKKGKQFHQVESQFGSLQRTIRLPDNLRLDPESVTASYSKGMLEISLPKLEPTPTARIPVKAG